MYRNNFQNDGRNNFRQYGRNASPSGMNAGYPIPASGCDTVSCGRPGSDRSSAGCMKSDSPCENSGCRTEEPSCKKSMQEMVLAMAYVPWQEFDAIYDLPIALQVGTIFPELNKPFMGSKGGKKCSCRQ